MSSPQLFSPSAFGRLWGRGHEVAARRILRVTGTGATSYLQGLVTTNLLNNTNKHHIPRVEPDDAVMPGIPKVWQLEQQKKESQLRPVDFDEQLRATCFLDNKGRIVTDGLLWRISDHDYYIDVPTSTGDDLLQHLKQYVLRRSKVKITDATDIVAAHVVYGTLNAQEPPPGYLARVDPRHPSLGMRVLRISSDSSNSNSNSDDNNTHLDDDPHEHFTNMVESQFPSSPGTYNFIRRLGGIAEGKEIAGKVAQEANQDLLGAVHFDKGCYLGQELTARVQYTGVLRKRIMPVLLLPTAAPIPPIWSMASSLQQSRKDRKYALDQLKKLPSRLPRLSIYTAGNFMTVMTGALEAPAEMYDEGNETAAEEWRQVQEMAQTYLRQVEDMCTVGAKIVDGKGGQTIGQVVTPPIEGTNLALALMKLDAVGMHQGNVWQRTNKVKLNSSSAADATSNDEFRYLPYLPLWWPDLHAKTGKALQPGEDNFSVEEMRDTEADPIVEDKNSTLELTSVDESPIYPDKESENTQFKDAFKPQ